MGYRRHARRRTDSEGNWKQVKDSVQARWGKPTDDDFDVVEDNQKELAGRIQEKYVIAEHEAERQIDDWLGHQ